MHPSGAMKASLRATCGRGGARPNIKKEEVDEQALHDSMQDFASRHGSQVCVQLGSYLNLNVSKAVNGRELCRLWPLTQLLLSHVPPGCLKLTSIRNVYVRFIAAHPALWKVLGSEKTLSEHAHDLANSWLTVMAHCRRVVDEVRFRQATLGLAPGHVKILEEIRSRFAQQGVQEDDEETGLEQQVDLDGLEDLCLPKRPWIWGIRFRRRLPRA